MTNAAQLQAAVQQAIDRHGGVRVAARALRIDHAYLYRLRSGEKSDPSDAVLRKLGLRRVVTYEAIASTSGKRAYE